MNCTPIKVLCVDDNFLVAEGIAIMLRMAGGFEWVGQLSSADDLVSEAARTRPDIVLLDIDLPGRDPFEALEELNRVCPDVRTIIFSGFVERDLVDRAVEAGAWGYLMKGENGTEVADAIARVLLDEFVMAPDIETLYTRKRIRAG
jgi:two-component system, NarL family, response regulator DesR